MQAKLTKQRQHSADANLCNLRRCWLWLFSEC
jgi:hypothetical protein